jgi:hypothetical protein
MPDAMNGPGRTIATSKIVSIARIERLEPEPPALADFKAVSPLTAK